MTDLDIIKQMEKILNVTLGKRDILYSGSRCYTLNQNDEVTGLNLYDCKLKNLYSIISPLKDLTKLTTLSLSFNQLSDISPLMDLTNLERLQLHSNQISDISPLNNLTILFLGQNQLYDISSVA